MQHFSISKSGFVMFEGKAVGTVFDASAREALVQLIQGKPATTVAKRKASTYPNGVGPNWMDRYIDPETGAKKKWNYKPSRYPSRDSSSYRMHLTDWTKEGCDCATCKAKAFTAKAA